jgi:D-arabinose 1-dehydrogenase-like Zn-dependent alcohol dehydrogenase
LRAIIIDAPGVKDNPRVGEAPQSIPGPGEVLIDVAYCGCNFADTMIVSGTYPHPKGYPIIGGPEFPGGSRRSGRASSARRSATASRPSSRKPAASLISAWRESNA